MLNWRPLEWSSACNRREAATVFGSSVLCEANPERIFTSEALAQFKRLHPHYVVCLKLLPGVSGVPHVDGHPGSFQWGLNFYVGDLKDHRVDWFSPKEGAQPTLNTASIPSLRYSLLDVDVLEQVSPLTSILFNASVPHRGVNLSQNYTRYCYSLRLDLPDLDSWEAVVRFFKPHLLKVQP